MNKFYFDWPNLFYNKRVTFYMKNVILISESGENCPLTGTWEATTQGKEEPAVLIVKKRVFESQEFPAINGKPTKWRMLLSLA